MALCSRALVAGGALALLLNLLLTPRLPVEAPFDELAASGVFLWRMLVAALVAALLTVGSAGMWRVADNPLRKLAAAIAFAGGLLLFAHEWNQVFFVRALALSQPGALVALEEGADMDLFDLGAMLAMTTFSLGWLMVGVSLLRSSRFARRGPLLLVGGFFLVPLLGAIVGGSWGMALGNVVLGLGWISLGRDLASAG